MIPAQPSPAQDVGLAASPDTLPLRRPGRDWRQLWREAVRDPRELLALVRLPGLAARVSDSAAARFPLRVPRGFVARMRAGDANDPLLRQVLPLDEEDRPHPGFALDAVGDGPARAATGVIHKYEGRALLVATGSCAIHCRYCFRRHFDYAADTAASRQWQDALAWLRSDPGISEVLLSGGDPLSLSTAKLAELTQALRGIPWLRRFRLHTRLPVVLPERVDEELLAWMADLPWPLTVVIHANHGNEIDDSVDRALGRMREAGAILLNQAVLLRGVNDRVEVLSDLSERLFQARVLPYYLHQLDRVAGTAHFEVDEAHARRLHSALQSRLPGYLVPRLVREVAGAPSKTPL